MNFSLNNHLLNTLAVGRAQPLLDRLTRLSPPPENGVWANLLRNLDEADLERWNRQDYEDTIAAPGADPDIRILGARPAPQAGTDAGRRRSPAEYGLEPAVCHAGCPLICYTHEIGMGEDLSQKGRNALRSPMQRTSGRNGGLSSARNRA